MKTKYVCVAALFLFIVPFSLSAKPSGSGTADKHPENEVTISGYIPGARSSDTVTVIILNEFQSWGVREIGAREVLKTPLKNGFFILHIKGINRSVYIDIYPKSHRSRHNYLDDSAALYTYLMEPGDSIYMVKNGDSFQFSGRGSAKYKCRQEMDRLRLQTDNERYAGLGIWSDSNFIKQFDNDQGMFDQVPYGFYMLSRKQKILESYRDQLNPDAYFLMKADLYGEAYGSKYSSFTVRMYGDIDSARKDRLIHQYLIARDSGDIDTSDSNLLSRSFTYPNFLMSKLKADYFAKYRKLPHSGSVIFDQIQENYSGLLMQKLMLIAINSMVANNGISDEALTKASGLISDPEYTTYLNKLKEVYLKGKTVLNFSFQDPKGKIYQPDSFKGKVVFFDMWFSGCTACIAVAKAMPAVEEQFKNDPRVVFVSLSIDTRKSQWISSIDPRGAPYFHVADGIPRRYSHYATATTIYLYTGGRGPDDVFIKKYDPSLTFPHLMLMGKDGKIYSGHPPNPSFENGTAALISLIKEAINE